MHSTEGHSIYLFSKLDVLSMKSENSLSGHLIQGDFLKGPGQQSKLRR